MQDQFDVFLSHNSKDKPTVRQLAQALRGRGLRVWLDEEQLVPGRPWQKALEETIQTTRTAAVLVGKDGLGPWEIPEMRACLSQFVKRGLPVIPVLLPDAPTQPELPLLLQELTWVDLRGGLTDPGLDRLEWGITGFKPGQSPACASRWQGQVLISRWQGQVLIDGESLDNWSVEQCKGSSGTLQLVPGLKGRAVQLNWAIGAGDWVHAKYTFPEPVDLSKANLFGVSLHGGGPSEIANTVAIMLADVNDVFYGYEIPGKDKGINQINRWLINLPLPKKDFYHFFTLGDGGTTIDWSRIDRFFLVVKRPPNSGLGGGSGQLKLDQLQYDTVTLESWPPQDSYQNLPNQKKALRAAQRAVDYLLASQATTGLFISWQQEPSQKAYLYDQALVLHVLTREGIWRQGQPDNAAAQAAQRLVTFLNQAQKSDGHWARVWDPHMGLELQDDGWVGDQAWWVMALASYATRSGDAVTLAAAQAGAAWLAAKISSTGKVVGSTEGNLDVWWALMATGRVAEADRIANYLDQVWDADLGYWWRGRNDDGSPDAVVAMDANTWGSAFSRHARINQPERGLAALRFVRKTLVTQSDNGTLCGLDGMGPVSIWNEGTAQYVAAGGKDGKRFLKTLLVQQNPDGSMPGSPDNWTSDAFGWLSHWSGLAPTAWLYFAVKGLPFPQTAAQSQ